MNREDSSPLKSAIMKTYMMRKDLTIAVAVTGILAVIALSSCTEDDNPVALAKAPPGGERLVGSGAQGK